MSARIGIVTGKGISRIIKENYARWVLYLIVLLLVIANTLNLGADFGALAASARLIVPAPFWLLTLLFCALTLLLEIFIPYRKYAKFLKWMSISLLAYFITGIIVAGNWPEIIRATFLPHFQFNFAFIMIITGVLGTTISPYMFFWQASQEVEEEEAHHMHSKVERGIGIDYIANMRFDTFFGMLFSEATTWFIMITTAMVLNKNGIVDIQTADQAASAIAPLVHAFPYSGEITHFLFAIGIIGTGLLAIPIFAATSSYAIAEIFGWREGLEHKFKRARAFYLLIIAGTFVGLLINFVGINPIKALVYTAVINGIIAVPLIFMLIRISGSEKIMGDNTSGFWSRLFSWITFLGMGAAAVFTIYGLFK